MNMYTRRHACGPSGVRAREQGDRTEESSRKEEGASSRGMKARKKGREQERESEKEREKGLSLRLAFDDASRASAGHFGRSLFFFYLMYIHDRVSHDDIGL